MTKNEGEVFANPGESFIHPHSLQENPSLADSPFYFFLIRRAVIGFCITVFVKINRYRRVSMLPKPSWHAWQEQYRMVFPFHSTLKERIVATGKIAINT